jgi:hypothetical protein
MLIPSQQAEYADRPFEMERLDRRLPEYQENPELREAPIKKGL